MSSNVSSLPQNIQEICLLKEELDNLSENFYKSSKLFNEHSKTLQSKIDSNIPISLEEKTQYAYLELAALQDKNIVDNKANVIALKTYEFIMNNGDAVKLASALYSDPAKQCEYLSQLVKVFNTSHFKI